LNNHHPAIRGSYLKEKAPSDKVFLTTEALDGKGVRNIALIDAER